MDYGNYFLIWCRISSIIFTGMWVLSEEHWVHNPFVSVEFPPNQTCEFWDGNWVFGQDDSIFSARFALVALCLIRSSVGFYFRDELEQSTSDHQAKGRSK